MNSLGEELAVVYGLVIATMDKKKVADSFIATLIARNSCYGFTHDAKDARVGWTTQRVFTDIEAELCNKIRDYCGVEELHRAATVALTRRGLL